MIALRRLALGILGLALLVTGTGCGKKPAPVTGLVTLDGASLAGASIEFVPEGSEGQPATGTTGADGIFRLTTKSANDGALPGNYKVVIKKAGAEAEIIRPEDTDAAMAKFILSQRNKGKAKPKGKDGKGLIPAAYSDPGKTTLRAIVPPPDGRCDFELHSEGG